LEPVFGRDRRVVALKRPGKWGAVMFWLKPAVKQRADDKALPKVEAVDKAILAGIAKSFESAR